MDRIKIAAMLVIGLGTFALNSEAAFASELSSACCTSGNGEETCCGETCSADEQNCKANPLNCIELVP